MHGHRPTQVPGARTRAPGLDGNHHLFHRDVAKICFEILFTDLQMSWCAQLTNIILIPESATERLDPGNFTAGTLPSEAQGNFTVLMDTSLQGVSEQGGSV